jgi:hypothetical protein
MTSTRPASQVAHLRELTRPIEAVASVYLDLRVEAGDAAEDIALRWRALSGRLLSDGAEPATVEELAAHVARAEPGPAGLVMFAADGEVRRAELLPGLATPDTAMFAAPAHLLPLLGWHHRHPPYVLVVTDRTGADLTVSAGGTAPDRVLHVTGPDDEIERNAPGGWAQMRYQHRAEDSWRHNAARVAEVVSGQVAAVHADVLVLTGDVRAVQLLTERLNLPAKHRPVLRQLSGSRAQDGSQAAREANLRQILQEVSDMRTAALLAEFAEQYKPGGLAVEGVHGTLGALARDRVRTLLVADEPADPRTAWFGAEPTEVYAVRVSTAGGAEVRPGRLADVAVRAALLTGADVRVIPAGTPGLPAQGLGALCRFG